MTGGVQPPERISTFAGRDTRQTSYSPWHSGCRAAAIASSVLLLGCVATFLFISRNWPLVNDAALMHYVLFLMEHGQAPYRQIGDINLPGAYVPEWLSLLFSRILGISGNSASLALLWRGMDAFALLLCGTAMWRIGQRTRLRFSWFPGIFGGCLFALYHGRDGIGQAGQRDLWFTLLLLWGMDALFGAMRTGRLSEQGWRVFGFGLLAGLATTVKPFGVGFLLCLLPLLVYSRRSARLILLACAAIGLLLPSIAELLFLLHWRAFGAFAQVLRVSLPYHASLARGSVWQLLGASTLSSVLKLLLLLLLTAAMAGGWRQSWQALRMWPFVRAGQSRSAEANTASVEPTPWHASPERLLLVLSVLLGLASFVVQGKGYPYQRYPYIAFLFLLSSLEFTSAVESGSKFLRAAGIAGISFGVLLCAPSYLRAAAKAGWSTPVTQAIERALMVQAGSHGIRSLDGTVQCIDVVSGCTDALLDLHLREATGTLYDEFLFPQAPAPWGTPYSGPASGASLPPAVMTGQQRFRAELLLRPARVIVISAWLFPQGPGNYRKLALWPWFNTYLTEHYVLIEQQEFARAENGPMGFRLYLRRPDALQ